MFDPKQIWLIVKVGSSSFLLFLVASEHSVSSIEALVQKSKPDNYRNFLHAHFYKLGLEDFRLLNSTPISFWINAVTTFCAIVSFGGFSQWLLKIFWSYLTFHGTCSGNCRNFFFLGHIPSLLLQMIFLAFYLMMRNLVSCSKYYSI